MPGLTFKRAALALASAALLLIGGAGLSLAQTATPTSPPASGQATAPKAARAVIDDAAAKLGLSGDQLAQALKEARRELGARSTVRLARQRALDVAAHALGLADARALRKELAGTTLTAVAQKHGVAPATVSAAIVADLNAQVDAQVAAGKLTAQRATTLKQRLATRVDALMAHQFKAAPAGVSRLADA